MIAGEATKQSKQRRRLKFYVVENFLINSQQIEASHQRWIEWEKVSVRLGLGTRILIDSFNGLSGEIFVEFYG